MITVQQRFDLALAGICALVVLGVVFFGFGLASWLFFSGSIAWTFWLLGFGLWLMAGAIFFLFMDHPYPKHGIRR